MTLPNHIIGGIFFTGAITSLAEINLFGTPWTLLATIVGAILPDIDHTASPVGRIMPPLTKWLQRKYGHRTVTHGFPCMLACWVVFGFVEFFFTKQRNASFCFLFAYFSHLLLDMCTVAGVPCLYPFNNVKFVMPENENYRMRSGNFRGETIAFCLFFCGVILLKPWFEQGFMETFNRKLGKPLNVVSEMQSGKDLVKVVYSVRRGSEIEQDSGFAIEATKERIRLLGRNGFVLLQEPDIEFIKTVPSHSGLIYEKRKEVFVQISLDSFASYFTIPVLSVAAQASAPCVWRDGIFEEKGLRFQKEYLDELSVIPAPSGRDTSAGRSAASVGPETRIPIIKERIGKVRSEYEGQLRKFWSETERLKQLKQQYEKESNLVEKDRIGREIRGFSEPKMPQEVETEISLMEAEIRAIETERQFRLQEAARQRGEAARAQGDQAEITVSGVIERLIISQTKND